MFLAEEISLIEKSAGPPIDLRGGVCGVRRFHVDDVDRLTDRDVTRETTFSWSGVGDAWILRTLVRKV